MMLGMMGFEVSHKGAAVDFEASHKVSSVTDSCQRLRYLHEIYTGFPAEPGNLENPQIWF